MLRFIFRRFTFFSDLLSGYPEQVLFAVDSISDLGLYAVRKDSHLIREYADDKAKVIVESFSNDQKKTRISLLPF